MTQDMIACGNILDRFPCKTCGAAVPKDCPGYERAEPQPAADATAAALEIGQKVFDEHGVSPALREAVELYRESAPPSTEALLEKAVGALRAIQFEAQRENGGWVHLKRVIALQASNTLAEIAKGRGEP